MPVLSPSSVEDVTDASRLNLCGSPPPGENVGSIGGRRCIGTWMPATVAQNRSVS